MRMERHSRAIPCGEAFLGMMVCLLAFACGVIIGSFSAAAIDTAETHALQLRISGYVSQIADGTYTAPGFLSVFWSISRYHLLVVFLGFSLLGVFALPIVAGVRGFYLSFSIAALIRAFGTGGFPLAFALFGASAIIAIPCFFVLATQAFSKSANLGKGVLGANKITLCMLYDRAYFAHAGICLIGLILAAAIELYITPLLLAWMN